MENTPTPFKLLAEMLQYPDAAYLRALPQLEAAVAQLPPGDVKSACEAFLEQLSGENPLSLQERYTAAFDLNPATSLNLTYHLWGDGEKRAGALTQLQQIYTDAGYEKTSAELPDYLPLLLEFVAMAPAARRAGPIRDCFAALAGVAERLERIAPPYVTLLRLLAGTDGRADTVGLTVNPKGVRHGSGL
jgi:nitrate reductase delta subunit